MKYKILMTYVNPSDKYQQEKNIDIEWNNLDVAGENLRRIREYDRYLKYNKNNEIEEPEWHKGLNDNQIKLILDDKTFIEYNCFWIGSDIYLILATLEIIY